MAAKLNARKDLNMTVNNHYSSSSSSSSNSSSISSSSSSSSNVVSSIVKVTQIIGLDRSRLF
jgi:hypothetical protein